VHVAQTEDDAYTQRLRARLGAGWKRRLDVQAPYRWNLRRLTPGRVLDAPTQTLDLQGVDVAIDVRSPDDGGGSTDATAKAVLGEVVELTVEV